MSTSTLSTAVPAMPAPMKPAPTTPSRRICRGAAAPGGMPSSFLSAVGGEEELHQLARHVAHGELAEGAVLRGQPRRDALLQPDAHRLERRERRRIVAAGLRQHLLLAPRGTPAAGRPRCGRAASPWQPALRRPRRGQPVARQPVGRGRARSARRMLGGTSSSTRPSLSALAPRSLLPVRIMSSAARAPISRGSRWEPPAPGMRPSCTSGRPSWVLGWSVATR